MSSTPFHKDFYGVLTPKDLVYPDDIWKQIAWLPFLHRNFEE